MTISALIVDDEAHARQALQHLLTRYPEISVVGECENGKEAVKAVHERQPEVIFLDIHMPKLDGFEVLELLGDATPLVIFVTAHDDYAIQAFEKNAVDYLLKPVSKERLDTSIQRIRQRLPDAKKLIESNTSAMLQEHLAQQIPLSRILVREKGDVFVVPTSEVYAIEAADDYMVIHTREKNYIKQERLVNLEKRLDPQQFCRIHRSTIINIDFLAGIESEGKDAKFATIKYGEEQKQFAVSRSGYSKLIALL